MTGIDLPQKPNCTQLDFDMFATSQSILDYVKQQEALSKVEKVPETPSNNDLPENLNDLPETPPETPKKPNDEEMISKSFPFPSRL